MENLRKKNETERQNTMEGHSSRLEQVEDRLLGLEDKMKIKGKTEELLVKQLMTCERIMQELMSSIRRPNLRIMGIKEEKEVQAKGSGNILKENNEKYPKSGESYAHSGTGSLQDTRLDQNRTSP
jgi:hypothetical protein